MTSTDQPTQKQKIAILGGGMGSLSAAFELTHPDNEGWQDRYEVTVYQLGWRLGGKGRSGITLDPRACGPDPGTGTPDLGPCCHRFEEHGIHAFWGFYQNVIGMMQECYQELGRSPDRPLATWDEAIIPNYAGALMQRLLGDWYVWPLGSPQLAGDDSLSDSSRYLALLVDLGRDTAVACAPLMNEPPVPREDPSFILTQELASRFHGDLPDDKLVVPHGAAMLARLIHEEPQGLQQFFRDEIELASEVAGIPVPELERAFAEQPEQTVWELVSKMMERFGKGLLSSISERLDNRESRVVMLWTGFNFLLGNIRGIIKDELWRNGLDSIDDQDYAQWLEPFLLPDFDLTLYSAWTRMPYAMLFAYENGDWQGTRLQNANLAAGVALQAMYLVLFQSGDGGGMILFRASTGATLFAPLYEVLHRRGVRFEFFHNVKSLHLSEDKTSIGSISVEVQATVRGSGPYKPLVDVKGLPCWTTEPLYAQLEQGEQLLREHVNLESWWTPWTGVKEIRLEAGADFDLVVLGIPPAVLPCIAEELCEANEDWKEMVDETATVRTQAFQTWLKPTLNELGWPSPALVSTYDVSPLNTWVDMAHLLEREAWPALGDHYPLDIGYFCGTMADNADYQGQPCREVLVPAAESAKAKAAAIDFLRRDVAKLWPRSVRDGDFDWNLLVDNRRVPAVGAERFDSQFWIANIDPSDRYTLSLKGTIRYRMKAAETGFANLYVTGDWIDNGLNYGCMEAAATAGMEVSYAISGYPTNFERYNGWRSGDDDSDGGSDG